MTTCSGTGLSPAIAGPKIALVIAIATPARPFTDERNLFSAISRDSPARQILLKFAFRRYWDLRHRRRLCRQTLQHSAVALDWLADMQAPLNFPDASRNWLHNRNAEIAFKRRHKTERVQAGT